MSNLAPSASYKHVTAFTKVTALNSSHVSPLILDRLSCTVKISQENAGYARQRFQKLHGIGAGFTIKKNEEKWITAQLVLVSADGGKAFAQVEINAQTPGKPYFRLDYNPAKLDAKAMDTLEEFLREVTPFDGLADMLKTATITRIDLARDLYGCAFMERLYTASKFQVGSAAFTNKKGMVQQVFGSPSSSRVSFYDKSEGGEYRVRVEYRCKKRMSILEASSLPNLFARARIYEQLAFIQLGIPQRLLPMFLDSCRCRGLKGAFKLWKENLKLQHLTQAKLKAFSGQVWLEWTASHDTWAQQLLDALANHRLHEPSIAV